MCRRWAINQDKLCNTLCMNFMGNSPHGGDGRYICDICHLSAERCLKVVWGWQRFCVVFVYFYVCLTKLAKCSLRLLLSMCWLRSRRRCAAPSPLMTCCMGGVVSYQHPGMEWGPMPGDNIPT